MATRWRALFCGGCDRRRRDLPGTIPRLKSARRAAACRTVNSPWVPGPASVGVATPGDKVMQIENDYEKEVYNGDIGTIDDVDANSGELMARFDGRSVTYGFGELDMLVPAYAATIHKSQGSEYPAVIIPVLTQHYAMLQQNRLPTGVTRGKKLVVLAGQKKAVAIAVRNVSERRRWSKLSEWLRPKPPVSRQFGMAN